MTGHSDDPAVIAALEEVMAKMIPKNKAPAALRVIFHVSLASSGTPHLRRQKSHRRLLRYRSVPHT